MGIFSKQEETTSTIDWISLDSLEDLEQAFSSTNEKPALFFKHSTRCPISKMALSRFEKSWENKENINLYYIDLLKHRDVSNAIDEQTKVEHQSPQAIVFFKGETLYHASHNGISTEEILKLI